MLWRRSFMCDTGLIYLPWINVDEFFEKGLKVVSSSDSVWYCSYNMYIYVGQIQDSLSMELWFLEAQLLSISMCKNTLSASHPSIFMQLLKCNIQKLINISSSLSTWIFYHKGRYPAVLKAKMSEENISVADVSRGQTACNERVKHLRNSTMSVWESQC